VRNHQRRSGARVCLLAALAAVASACYPARGGFWPPAERLPELRPGVSSRADVEALLGAPLGRGAARFTPEMARREVWVYGYFDFDGTSTKADQGQLMVFFDGSRYDGYFWTTRGKPPESGRGASQQ
jgi:hypothetical protein